MPKYVGSDQIGTNRCTSDSDLPSNVTSRQILTSFGELVDGTAPRYGYAGAFGYQKAGTGDPLSALGWLHVGERYYAPGE